MKSRAVQVGDSTVELDFNPKSSEAKQVLDAIHSAQLAILDGDADTDDPHGLLSLLATGSAAITRARGHREKPGRKVDSKAKRKRLKTAQQAERRKAREPLTSWVEIADEHHINPRTLRKWLVELHQER